MSKSEPAVASQDSPNPSSSGTVDQYSPLVHRLAFILTLSVFPLIWVGGLVTTYGAGMAVPDWPQTYGWNMFLYPPSTWLYGGFDLMVEHGHRLLGSLAGLFAIALVVAAWTRETRVWFRWWCLFVLLAVIAQGLLGGFRVRLDARTFAMIHGCTAQLFLAIATATSVMSSRWWKTAGSTITQSLLPACNKLKWFATALLLCGYCQVVAGAQLRHVTGDTNPSAFMGLVHIHLTLAATVLVVSLIVGWMTLSNSHLLGGVRRLGVPIMLAVLTQICLGVATWIVNYALPWQEISSDLSHYTIQAKGYWESMIVTAHVATGAIIISLATVLSVRSWRSRAVAAPIPVRQ